jgi:hypothetical protein
MLEPQHTCIAAFLHYSCVMKWPVVIVHCLTMAMEDECLYVLTAR